MKYHNFSEALRGSIAIQNDNDLIAIVIPEKGNATYLVSSIVKSDNNEVTIVAYSAEFMRIRNMTVLPVTYKTLKEFENSKINNPQSFIPLGSTFDKDLPDVRIFIDSNEIQHDYRCLSTKFMDGSDKHIMAVMVFNPLDNPSHIDTIVDHEISKLQSQINDLTESEEEHTEESDQCNDNYASGHKTEKLTRVEVIMHEIQTPTIKVPATLDNCTLNILSEIYFVEQCEFGEGAVGLIFPDGTMKCIPLNHIKEINIEKKK